MGVAAAGLLPVVWGALLQEGIDVTVILNALRALRTPAPEVRLTAADTALTRRFRTEHQAIRADIEQVRAAADGLDTPGAMTRVRQVYDMLTREVWPHENAEETELYPSLNRLLGGADPTAPMSRATPRSPTRSPGSAGSSTTSAPAPRTTPTSPTCAVSFTGCTPSSGCTPSRKTRPTCRSATARTPFPADRNDVPYRRIRPAMAARSARTAPRSLPLAARR
jgi:Hemerythrin HHE cation binding domain